MSREKPPFNEAMITSLSLNRLGDYVGKLFGQKLNEEYKLRELLETWVKENPDLSNISEHGFLLFVKSFFSTLCNEMFSDTNTTVKIEINSIYNLYRTILLEHSFPIKYTYDRKEIDTGTAQV